MAFVELLIPCIQHLEYRIGEIFVNMIIWFDFQKRQQSAAGFLAELQKVFRTEVLGSPECPSQWKLPFKKESDGSIQIEPIQEHNTVIHRMLKYIEKIMQGAVPDSEQIFKDKSISACTSYSEAMKILTTYRTLTDEEMKR